MLATEVHRRLISDCNGLKRKSGSRKACMIQIMPSSLGCFGALLGSVVDVLLFVL